MWILYFTSAMASIFTVVARNSKDKTYPVSILERGRLTDYRGQRCSLPKIATICVVIRVPETTFHWNEIITVEMYWVMSGTAKGGFAPHKPQQASNYMLHFQMHVKLHWYVVHPVSKDPAFSCRSYETDAMSTPASWRHVVISVYLTPAIPYLS